LTLEFRVKNTQLHWSKASRLNPRDLSGGIHELVCTDTKSGSQHSFLVVAASAHSRKGGRRRKWPYFVAGVIACPVMFVGGLWVYTKREERKILSAFTQLLLDYHDVAPTTWYETHFDPRLRHDVPLEQVREIFAQCPFVLSTVTSTSFSNWSASWINGDKHEVWDGTFTVQGNVHDVKC
jgi:hypothetical protein